MVQLKEKRGGKYFCVFISINILRWDISDNSSILQLSPDEVQKHKCYLIIDCKDYTELQYT